MRPTRRRWFSKTIRPRPRCPSTSLPSACWRTSAARVTRPAAPCSNLPPAACRGMCRFTSSRRACSAVQPCRIRMVMVRSPPHRRSPRSTTRMPTACSTSSPPPRSASASSRPPATRSPVISPAATITTPPAMWIPSQAAWRLPKAVLLSRSTHCPVKTN